MGSPPRSYPPSAWFAVQVWTGREVRTADHLRTRGYEIFLPSYREHRRWSDRMKVVDRMLLPGYVLCRLSAGMVGPIVTTPGVVRIVGDSRGPIAVEEHEVAAVQRIVETHLPAEPWGGLKVGQRVRVERGPLQGLEGVVLMTRKAHRLVVELSLLQRAVAVEIEPHWVAALPQAFPQTVSHAS